MKLLINKIKQLALGALVCVSAASAQTYTLVSENASATASSIESQYQLANFAIDGDMGTRWSSQHSDFHWLQIDLGSVQAIEKLELNWESAYAQSYKIYVSETSENWGIAVHVRNDGDGGLDEIIQSMGSGQFITIECLSRATIYGFSLYEVAAYTKRGMLISWLGELNGYPENPQAGEAFFHTSENKSFVYQNAAWELFAIGETGATGPQGSQGEIGVQGEQGVQGDTGGDGTNGTNGTSFLSGLIAPISSLGNDGDTYLDMELSAYYKKINGSWERQVRDESKSFLDSRDGQIYGYVTIGNQVWMTRNLSYDTGSSYCLNSKAENCELYGRLYKWNDAMAGAVSSNSNPSGVQGICPDGWHVPSNAEWNELENFVDNNNGSDDAGKSLKTTYDYRNNGNGTDAFGFHGLPSGYSHNGGNSPENYAAYFQTTLSGGSQAVTYRFINDSHDELRSSNMGWEITATAVRCVQDQ